MTTSANLFQDTLFYDSVSVNAMTCASLISTDTMSCGTNSMTCGQLSCASLNSSGAIMCGGSQLTSSGSVLCDSITNTGTIQSVGAATVGTLDCASLYSSGTVSCGTNAATCGALTCASINAVGGSLIINSSNLTLNTNCKISMPRADPVSDSIFIDYRNTSGYGIYTTATSSPNRGTSLDFKYNDYNNGGGNMSGTALSIGPTGCVGINSSYGVEPLEVTGNVYINSGVLDNVTNYTASNTIVMARFLNSSIGSGSHIALMMGQAESIDKSALLIYESRTNSSGFCSLGSWGSNNVINWDVNQKVGINQPPGIEALEVNGNMRSNNIICADLTSSGKVYCMHTASAGMYSPPMEIDFLSIFPGLLEIRNQLTSGGHDCGLLLTSVTSSANKRWRFVTYANTGEIKIRDENSAYDKLNISSSSNLVTFGQTLCAQEANVYMAPPSISSSCMCLTWNYYAGAGMSHIINSRGGGLGGVSMGEYSSGVYYEDFRVGSSGLVWMPTKYITGHTAGTGWLYRLQQLSNQKGGCYRITVMCKDNGSSDFAYGTAHFWWFGNSSYTKAPDMQVETIGTSRNITFYTQWDTVDWHMGVLIAGSGSINFYYTIKVVASEELGY